LDQLKTIGPELPGIARAAIVRWVTDHERLRVERPDAPPAAVFVTLRRRDGSLRGCIGSLNPTQSDVCGETARSAVLAASRDPRFTPVRPDEIEELTLEVSVLTAPEPIAGIAELDPTRFGVVVKDDSGRQGLLLPDVPGIDDPATQVAVARTKAGIDPETSVTLQRFTVRKFI
jgi:AmmeMemoRadiSam system protein A